MDQEMQVYAPPPVPRRDWGWVVRLALPGLVVFLFGFVLGAYLAVAGQSQTFTGGRVVDRPRDDQSFSWPLRLTHRINILVIGTDVTFGNRRQILPIARADSLLLASFYPATDKINSLSIPRDTRAAIPGVGVTKINAAYAFGGPGLTIRTVEDLLGVKVDFYIKLGPKSFAQLGDAIGGAGAAGARCDPGGGVHPLPARRPGRHRPGGAPAEDPDGALPQTEEPHDGDADPAADSGLHGEPPDQPEPAGDDVAGDVLRAAGGGGHPHRHAARRVHPQLLGAGLGKDTTPGPRSLLRGLARDAGAVAGWGPEPHCRPRTGPPPRRPAGRARAPRLLAEFLGNPRVLRQAQAADVDITVLLARGYASISLLVR